MKTTIDTLRTKAATPTVVTAAIMAMTLGGVRLSNHNETVLRDRS